MLSSFCTLATTPLSQQETVQQRRERKVGKTRLTAGSVRSQTALVGAERTRNTADVTRKITKKKPKKHNVEGDKVQALSK